MATQHAPPLDAAFQGTADRSMALLHSQSAILKLRLFMVAMLLATHAQGVLTRIPAAVPNIQLRLMLDTLATLAVEAPRGAVGPLSTMLMLQ